LEPSEADSIAAYYASHENPDRAISGDLRDRFEEVCETCHFLDIVLQPPKVGNWRQTLLRMQWKTPSLISEEEVLALEPWIEREIENPDRFLRRFPHSTIRNAWMKP